MRSQLTKSIALAAALLLAGAGTGVRADDAQRTPISRESIISALGSFGVSITTDQLEPLAGMTAAEANPRLRVVSVDVLDGESDKARLQCEHPNTCLPFYVVVHWGRSGDVDRRGRQISPVRIEDALVRSGKAAVLVIEGDYIRMTLPVLCLQSGGRGQKVRVIDKGTKKTYLARVTGPGVVMSMLSN